MITSGPVKLLVFLLASQILLTHGAVQISHENRLIRDLIRTYSERGKTGRPVQDHNETITIFYGVSLSQILDLDEKSQTFSTSVWETYIWNDIYLRWNESEYGYVSTVRVSSGDIWKPDIKLYNYADTRLEEKKETLCIISSNGNVMWNPQAILKSSCSVDIRYFPFDEQSCYLKFGSWTLDGTKLDLQFRYSDINGFQLHDYITSNEWEIISTTSERNIKYYPCCPEPYVDLVFRLVIRRKAEFYNYILILPCVLLSILSLVPFWIPPESPAKIQLGMNIYVAFFILLLLLADSTPPATGSVPLIGTFYCLNMVLITLSTLSTAVVVNLYFHGPMTRVPRLFAWLMLNFFAKVFFMTNSLMDKQEWEERKKSIKFHDEEESVSRSTRQPIQDKDSSVSSIKTTDKRDVQFKNDLVVALELESETWRPSNTGFANESDVDPKLPVPLHLTDPILPVTSHIPDRIQSLLFQYTQLKREVNEIKKLLKTITDKSAENARLEYLAREWKLVALVLDILFFYLYLLCILLSTVTLFKTSLFQT